MSGDFCRIGTEIVCHAREQNSGLITAQVRLRYSFPDCHESVKLTRVEIPAGTEERWRRTMRRIEARAWDWLEEYFGGTCLGSDPVNIFDCAMFDEFSDAKDNPSELSPEQEEDLQRELRQIELNFAA